MEAEKLEPDVVIYNTVIDGLCKYRHPDDALDLFNEMENKEGKLLEAEKLYEEMIKRSIAPDIVTYNSLINGFCMQSRLDEAKQMFEMVSKGCLPDVVTYNTLINGFCKSKRVEMAWNSFVRCLKEDWLETQSLTHSYPRFFQAGDCESAQQVFKQMVSADVPPDIWTYNILLDGLCKNGKLEKHWSYSRICKRVNGT
ncbi:unnamed protein product [Microthlaspi erraticum]|uniref:Pentacotripeptide-repeat region of PRORP domain-containing protein n=1 Tax=Microthlaspi erraticum TaxID=1685480 RepID=A0A6D2IT48_9BRAS|nr:unnamed protein product [Microthlaspi erraticum]